VTEQAMGDRDVRLADGLLERRLLRLRVDEFFKGTLCVFDALGACSVR
jgi:hypothetical protein